MNLKKNPDLELSSYPGGPQIWSRSEYRCPVLSGQNSPDPPSPDRARLRRGPLTSRNGPARASPGFLAQCASGHNRAWPEVPRRKRWKGSGRRLRSSIAARFLSVCTWPCLPGPVNSCLLRLGSFLLRSFKYARSFDFLEMIAQLSPAFQEVHTDRLSKGKCTP